MNSSQERRGQSPSRSRQDVCAPSGSGNCAPSGAASGAPSSNWRVFCAVELPQIVCDQANEHIRTLKDRFPNVRASWTRAGKFHLTLKFLGEIQRERVENLSSAGTHAAISQKPFKLIIEGAGSFPQRGPAKVLWLGVTDIEGGLTHLHKRLEEESGKQGFARDARAFHPHLTLARLRESEGARPLVSLHREIGFAAVEFTVSELQVIRSELSKRGSEYTVVSRHALGSPRASG